MAAPAGGASAQESPLTTWVVIGLAIGVGLGMVVGDLLIGLLVGLALGAAIGGTLRERGRPTEQGRGALTSRASVAVRPAASTRSGDRSPERRRRDRERRDEQRRAA